MAVRNIVKIGDDILRKVCRTQLTFDDRLAMILDDMAETMYKAQGVGLAAPQVNVLRRIAVVDPEDGNKYELVNPVIVKSEGFQVGQEGCLSIPGFNCNVRRPYKISVEAQDRNGNRVKYDVEGFPAVVFCHEIDHLDGILFKDKRTEEEPTR